MSEEDTANNVTKFWNFIIFSHHTWKFCCTLGIT